LSYVGRGTSAKSYPIQIILLTQFASTTVQVLVSEELPLSFPFRR